MRRTAPLALLVILAFALLAAGCGDGNSKADKNDYIEKNNEIQREVTKGISAISGSDPKSIEAAQDEVDKAVTDLKALEVPSDFEKDHDKLVGSVEEMSDIMGDMADAIEKEDTEAISGIQTRITDAQDDFQEAVKSMNDNR